MERRHFEHFSRTSKSATYAGWVIVHMLHNTCTILMLPRRLRRWGKTITLKTALAKRIMFAEKILCFSFCYTCGITHNPWLSLLFKHIKEPTTRTITPAITSTIMTTEKKEISDAITPSTMMTTENKRLETLLDQAQ